MAKQIRPLEGDVSKLPKWAQGRIRVLEMRLREANQAIAEMHGEAKTNVFIIGSFPEDDKPLIRDAYIRFVLPDGKIHCRIDKDMLDIWGEPTLIVLPRASNTVSISPKRLRE